MGHLEAAAVVKEIIAARADLLKIARIATLMDYKSILDLESVKAMLDAVGEPHG